MGFSGGAGGGTDSDQSRSSGAVDIQTLNGMQESGVQQHFAMHQQRQRPEVIRIVGAQGPAGTAGPRQGGEAAALALRPEPHPPAAPAGPVQRQRGLQDQPAEPQRPRAPGVRNNDATQGLFPGTIEPSCFIKRIQLYSNGQRTDDISEYGRSCFLYSLLKPQEWYNQRGLEGFWQDLGGNAVEIPAGEYRDVLMSPTLIGLFQSGKMLPPQLNLVAEAGDALRPAGGTSDFSIESVRVLASQVTLDSALVESFNKVLLSGRSLVFSYPTMHTQVSNVPAGVTSHNVTVARAYTKLMGAFVTFRQTTDSLGERRNLEYPGPAAHPFNLEGQMQLGALQYPRYPVSSSAEFHHFLEIMGGTYDSKIKNMRIVDQFYPNTEFIAAFPTERVPKHPLSGISTRSGDLARFTFKNMLADRAQRMYIHLETMSLFESTITGNILNDGGTTEISGITAGQLATVLTAYTPLTDTAANAAAIGTNAAGVAANTAAVASLQRTSQPHRPERQPRHGVDAKSTPASVDAKLASYSSTAATNSAIASANNATLATVGS
ncbi:unnamed protein product, partial [Symbiodinium pilosum]